MTGTRISDMVLLASLPADALVPLISQSTGPTTNYKYNLNGLLDDVDDALADVAAALAATSASFASRTLMAAVASPTNGQRAYLWEAGRQGWFTFSTVNLSTEVTADTYQAIYVPPASDTDGSSGAWVREVKDNIYQFSWTGVTAATANATPLLESFLNNTTLVPLGAEFVFPPHDATLGASAGTRGITRGDLIVRGHGYKSRIILDYAGAGAVDLLYFRTGSNVAIRDIRFSGHETSLSGNPACIRFGTQSASVEPTLQQNLEVSGCFFDTTSLGIVVSSTTGPTQNLRAKDVRIFNNEIISNGQGVSLFGAENVQVYGNRITMVDSTNNNLCAPFRCIGSHNVMINNNICRGTTEFALFGGGATRDNVYFMTSEDVSIIDNDFENCTRGGFVFTSGVAGYLTIQGNRVRGSIASTSSEMPAVYLYVGDLDQTGGTVLHYFNKVIVKENFFLGYHTSVFTDGPGTTHTGDYLLLENNTFIGNASTDRSGAGLLIWSQFNCFSLMDVFGNKVLQVASGAIADTAAVIQCANMTGQIIRTFGNHFPEGTNTAVYGTSGTPGALEGALADNFIYPSGAYAAAT